MNIEIPISLINVTYLILISVTLSFFKLNSKGLGLEIYILALTISLSRF